jgi:hypothetical protein
MHQLGGGLIYVITILENCSRAVLASAVSRTKDLTAYLMVLYAAIRQHGSPEALVSDSDSVFKAKEAMRIYAALGIQKEQIDRKQAWQSYIETHCNVQRRMADWHVSKALSAIQPNCIGSSTPPGFVEQWTSLGMSASAIGGSMGNEDFHAGGLLCGSMGRHSCLSFQASPLLSTPCAMSPISITCRRWCPGSCSKRDTAHRN